MSGIELRRGGGDGVEISDLAARVGAAQANAERLAAASTDVEGDESLTPEARRDALNALRAEMDSARAELEAASAELQAAFEAQLAQAKSALAPLQEKASQIMSAVQAISLYLGSDEEIVVLREGEPAPADTPIHVYQTTLYMDEEMALAAEAAGIADATIDPGEKGWASFDAWLLADDAHVDQVCPAQRGVVAFRSARTQRRFDGTNVAGDGSEITHFLVRNGAQLAWVVASEDFTVGARLIPAKDEFEKFFYDRWSTDEFGNRRKLTFGTHAWDRAQREADALQRHYLKIALILQGIVDRTTLLSPLPAEEISFTSVESYDAGHVVAVVDDDGSKLPSGVLPYPAWRRQIQADLEAGQRVVLGHIPYNELYGNSREYIPGVLHPRTAEHPPTGEPFVVKRKSSREFSVSFRRNDKVWKRNQPVPDQPGYVYAVPVPVPAKGWASVTFYGDEDWVLPIDHPLVSVETIEWYLMSRENRPHFRSMIPLLRSARKVLLAEREAEAPFIDLLVAESQRRHDLDGSDAANLVAEVVAWWKTKKRQHRPLVAGDDADDAAFREIVTEVGRRVGLRSLVDDPDIVARIDEAFPDAMYIGRRHDGTYVAISPCDDRDVYVNVASWSAKRGVFRGVDEWVVCPDVRGWKTVRSSKRFESWPRYVDTASEVTGPELDELVGQLRALHPDAFAVVWYAYWSWGGSARDLRVYFPGDAPVVDVDRPLVGENRRGRIGVATFGWRRVDGTVKLVERHLSSDGYETVGSDGWSVPDRDGVVWSDQAAVDALVDRYRSVWEEHARRAAPLRAAVDGAHERFVAAWEQRALERQYASFVAKYGAESKGRWEAHRKMIAAKLRFPFSRSTFDELFAHAAELGLLAAENVTVPGLLAAVRAAGVEVPLRAGVLDDLDDLEF